MLGSNRLCHWPGRALRAAQHQHTNTLHVSARSCCMLPQGQRQLQPQSANMTTCLVCLDLPRLLLPRCVLGSIDRSAGSPELAEKGNSNTFATSLNQSASAAHSFRSQARAAAPSVLPCCGRTNANPRQIIWVYTERCVPVVKQGVAQAKQVEVSIEP